MDLKRYGEQLRTLRRQAGLGQEQLADALVALAQAGPADEFRVVDGTLVSRWESAREHKGRQWKPTRAYTIHLIRLFIDYLDGESARMWAADAGFQLSQVELRELFPAASAPVSIPDSISASTAVAPSLLPPLPSQSQVPQGSTQPTSIPHNIPSALTSFVGRDDEIALLAQSCQSPVSRLMTIVGEGGVGKTRLALAFAQSLLAQASGTQAPVTQEHATVAHTREPLLASGAIEQLFPDGIWFTSLAGLNPREVTNRSNQLATAVVEAVGYVSARTELEPAEQLLQYVRPRAQLLILDNFEVVMEGTTYLLELLQQAPRLRVLVTSRMSLNCQAERVLRLQGLAFGSANQSTQSGQAGQVAEQAQEANGTAFDAPCVQLFVERARQQGVDLSQSPLALQAVSRLCRQVNGNPLAVELAAHWVQHYSVEEIVDVLGQYEHSTHSHSAQSHSAQSQSAQSQSHHEQNLLMTDQQDVPLRHRSMEVVFETSWQLLSREGQRFLAFLSVLRGPFSREAAWAVAGVSPRGLADLVNRSLLHVQDESASTRGYAMHDLLRQFALAKLGSMDNTLSDGGQVGLESLAHERHCGYYLNFLAARMQALHGRGVKEAVAEILAVIDNVRAAWHWAVNQKQMELLAQAWPALRAFYHVRSLFQEGEELFRLAAAQLARSDLAAELLIAQAFFLNLLHRYDQAIAVAQAVIAQPDLADAAVAAAAHLEWGIALSLQGHHEESLAHLHKAIALARKWQLLAVEARSHRAIYRVLLGKGELGEAMSVLQQTLRNYQELGYHLNIGFVYRSMGQIAWRQGDYAQALAYYEECIAVYEEADDQPRAISIWPHLGEIHDALDDLGRAYHYFDLAYRHREESQDRRHAANTIAGFARLTARLGDYQKARQYGQQALAEHRQLGNEAGVIDALCILASVHLQQGDAATAATLYLEALTMARSSHAPLQEGIALVGLGKAQSALSHTTEASAYQQALAAFQQALAIQRRLGQKRQTLETLGELARLHMLQGNQADALAFVEEILAYLDSEAVRGSRERLSVLLICYQVLQTYGDVRAPQLLNESYQQLQREAATIGDEALRQSFLHNVRVNRMITALYTSATA